MRGRAWLLAHVAWLALTLATFAEESAQHTVHLEIHDEVTGSDLAVSVTRKVTAGTTGLDLMEDVVNVKFRRYPGFGVFVTSLCGITAPRGTFWALSIDGKRAEKGIGDLRIQRPVRIRWDLARVDATGRTATDQTEGNQ